MLRLIEERARKYEADRAVRPGHSTFLVYLPPPFLFCPATNVWDKERAGQGARVAACVQQAPGPALTPPPLRLHAKEEPGRGRVLATLIDFHVLNSSAAPLPFCRPKRSLGGGGGREECRSTMQRAAMMGWRICWGTSFRQVGEPAGVALEWGRVVRYLHVQPWGAAHAWCMRSRSCWRGRAAAGGPERSSAALQLQHACCGASWCNCKLGWSPAWPGHPHPSSPAPCSARRRQGVREEGWQRPGGG